MCDVDEEMATEYSIIGQTSSISSTSGSGSTSAAGASSSIGGSGNGGAAVAGTGTNLPIQSTRQYITVTQSPLIQKRTNNAKQEATDVKVSKIISITLSKKKINDVDRQLTHAQADFVTINPRFIA